MAVPNDPLFSQQWHLRNNNGLDLNVVDVWNDYTGAGVDVFVFDDGFDYFHADLDDNYDTTRDRDFGGNDDFPFGFSTDSHGTAVAGIIGAEANNNYGGVGVAYDSTLVGMRDFGNNITTFEAFVQVLPSVFNLSLARGADVINISQGLANTPVSVMGALFSQAEMDAVGAAIDNITENGRGGLGTVIVKSAGNSRGTAYDTNGSFWSADTKQVVVAAVLENGNVTSYSSFGASNLVSGFGSPLQGEVVTTDRRGSAGYDNGDFTFGFNGTSAAAPMVAGVVALMLEANPNLGWRDVQDILAASARHVGSDIGAGPSGSELYRWSFNGADDWNGGGMHFSNDYGYGLVDAQAAVRMAENWHVGARTVIGERARVSDNEGSSIERIVFPGGETLDGTPRGGNTNGTVGSETYNLNESFDLKVERVEVTIDFSTTYIADLDILLISPDGTRSILINDLVANVTQRGNDFDGVWTFQSQAFRGESSAGQWQLLLRDDASGDETVIRSIELRSFGKRIERNDDRLIYTDEFSEYANINGRSKVLRDTDGGIDTVDASAVTTASIIDIQANKTSRIDGVELKTRGAGVDHIIGGDGDDFLTGNARKNQIVGGRGDDMIDGRGDADRMTGGEGNDSYVVDNAGDRTIERRGEGTDEVTTTMNLALENNVEDLIMRGSAQRGTGNRESNEITGNAVNNIIVGERGGDKLFGRAGNDKLVGDEGND
ncbi:MAG: S8 family serine peptidase, partial [Pseudomonadota bacterium]